MRPGHAVQSGYVACLSRSVMLFAEGAPMRPLPTVALRRLGAITLLPACLFLTVLGCEPPKATTRRASVTSQQFPADGISKLVFRAGYAKSAKPNRARRKARTWRARTGWWCVEYGIHKASR